MPNSVPDGWQNTRFEDVATVGRGLTYSNQQECSPRDDGAVCVLRIPNVQEQRFDPTNLKYIKDVSPKQAGRYHVPKEAILMVGSNGNAARVGNCCFVDIDCDYVFASFLMRVVPDTQKVFPRYFYYLLVAGDVQDAITDSVAGTTGLKNISLGMLREYGLVLPPLSEQRKIAAILSSVDGAIQATEAVIAQTRRVKEGLLQELLTKGIGHTRFKKTAIGEIPETWEVMRLGDIVIPKSGLQTGPFGGQLHASDYTENGVPVIMPKDIVSGRLTSDTAARIPEALADSQNLRKHRLREGDIVFGRRGDIGRCGLVGAEHAGWLCGTGCLRARPKEDIQSNFLIHRLHSEPAVRWLNENAVGQTMLNLNTTILGDLPLTVPPLQEQIKIAEIISSVNQTVRDDVHRVSHLQQTKAGLLQDLLTGKKRVVNSEL